MTNIDDMKSMVQEWMADALSAVELAKVYAELMAELDKQLEYCTGEFTSKGEKK